MSERAEQRRVLEAVEREREAGRPFALATIVETRGSTYRGAGARLVVKEDGTWRGNLSGGCLEGEVVAAGERVMASRSPELLSFDLTADDEAIWGWGLGCNGAIDVLVEPSDSAAEAAALLGRAEGTGRSHVLITVLDTEGVDLVRGRHLLLEDAGDLLPSEVRDEAGRALEEGRSRRSRIATHDGEVDVLLEVIRPPLQLVVCGAGHDAVPLVRQAGELGWVPVVVDDRSVFLDESRFPDAAAFVHTAPEDAADSVDIRERTAVVVMSHNFLRDVDYLGSFLGTDIDYLGMLGPSRRLERLLDHLEEHRGIRPSEADRTKLHGPAGLDLGAEGPEEIAWAICAEVLAVDRGRGGGSLAQREGPIHPRDSNVPRDSEGS